MLLEAKEAAIKVYGKTDPEEIRRKAWALLKKAQRKTLAVRREGSRIYFYFEDGKLLTPKELQGRRQEQGAAWLQPYSRKVNR